MSLRRCWKRAHCCFLFFFQAEDGIRDVAVTGVQTCALPISAGNAGAPYAAHAAPAFPAVGNARVRAPSSLEIGRASCRERVEIAVVAVSVREKKWVGVWELGWRISGRERSAESQ